MKDPESEVFVSESPENTDISESEESSAEACRTESTSAIESLSLVSRSSIS